MPVLARARPPLKPKEVVAGGSTRTLAPIEGCASGSSALCVEQRQRAGRRSFCPLLFEVCQRQIRDFSRKSRCGRRSTSVSDETADGAHAKPLAPNGMTVAPMAAPALRTTTWSCRWRLRQSRRNAGSAGRKNAFCPRIPILAVVVPVFRWEGIKARDRPATSLQTRHDRPAAGVAGSRNRPGRAAPDPGNCRSSPPGRAG